MVTDDSGVGELEEKRQYIKIKPAPVGSDYAIAVPKSALEDLSRKRKQVHTSRLYELDHLSKSIQQEDAISLEERQRQMGIVYSRRKRVRQSQRADNLTETLVSHQEKNERLLAENNRLQELLLQAIEMVEHVPAPEKIVCAPHKTCSGRQFVDPQTERGLLSDTTPIISLSCPPFQQQQQQQLATVNHSMSTGGHPSLWEQSLLNQRMGISQHSMGLHQPRPEHFNPSISSAPFACNFWQEKDRILALGGLLGTYPARQPIIGLDQQRSVTSRLAMELVAS